MWQLPLGGLRDYALPETIAERLERFRAVPPVRGILALDPTYRGDWNEATKIALIERGYRLTDDALAESPRFLEKDGRGPGQA